MSLSEISLIQVVKKQYRFKLKSYVQVFSNLIFLQLLAVFFSLNGVGMFGTSSESINISVHFYSADIVAGFTMLWGFITAILITSKAYRNDDFAFVTNRISSNLSNTIFLLTASFIGGMTVMLTSYLLKLIVYFFVGQQYISSTPVIVTELLLGIFTTSLYVFLFCAVGYFVGTLVQINRVFIVLLPALFFGALILEGRSGSAGSLTAVFSFIFQESSIPLFFVKVIVIASLLFSGAFVLSNRMEVKQ